MRSCKLTLIEDYSYESQIDPPILCSMKKGSASLVNHTAFFHIAYSRMHNQEKYGLVHKIKGWPGRTKLILIRAV